MLNRDMKDFVYEGAAIIGQIKESKEITDNEAELTKRIKDKEVFVVKISGLRKEDDEVTAKVIGDYMGVIPKAQVSNRTYIRNKMDELIGQNVPVIVKSFNTETKIVQLSRLEAIKELRAENKALIENNVNEIGTLKAELEEMKSMIKSMQYSAENK